MTAPTRQLKVRIIGPGRVGRTLALRHRQLDHQVELCGRSAGNWQQWAKDLNISTSIGGGELGDVDIVLLCVDDASLPDLIEERASQWRDLLHRDQPLLIAHTSGRHGLWVFDSLAPANAAVQHGFGALHPIHPFANPKTSATQLDQVFVTAATLGCTDLSRALVNQWGCRWIPMPATANRQRYHLALSLAANHVTGVLARAESLLRDATTLEAAQAIVHTLAQSAVQAYGEHGAEQALTGPMVRGDLETLQAHLREVPMQHRRLQLQEWRALCDLAQSSGRLNAETANDIRKWLHQELSSAPQT